MATVDARDPRPSGPVGQVRRPPRDDTDHGLEALRDATVAYARLREELLEERAANTELERRVLALGETIHALEARNADLQGREAALHEELLALRERARIEERRAADLLTSVQEMHRALFHGTTWEHILRASLNVTDAERGYYISEEPAGLRVRAAIDVPARVGQAPSPFITAIVRKVIGTGEALHWTDSAPPDGATPADDEHFREGVAVPVTLRGGPCGVIIALDRDGEFHDEDVRSLLSVGTEAGVVVENVRLRQDLQRAYIATISMLADTVSAKDPYTRGHCEQVSHYARAAAERLSLSSEDRRIACYAALLHDVGKIGVSDGILNKPGPLIAEERRLVEAHVRIGHDLLASIPALRDVAVAVLHHHEWWDGSGYPDGRAGEDIPIASRIVSVVDAYCAMIDERAYKAPISPAKARAELQRCAGTQFDPGIVDAVIEAIVESDSAAAEQPVLDPPPGCGILPGMLSRP